MRTSKLTGAALDWAVAKIERGGDPIYRFAPAPGDKDYKEGEDYSTYFYISGPQRMGPYSPSTKWEQGGPIIERELHAFDHMQADHCCAIIKRKDMRNGGWNFGYGPTPLIAAMRCYVAYKLGDEIDIPKELEKS